jgi:D-alanyl-D-alanine carboxypeptidase
VVSKKTFLLAAVLVSLAIGLRLSIAQSPQSAKSTSGLSNDERSPSIISSTERSVSSPPFASASSANTRLKTELNWSFGSKAQRGWGIYAPLISQTIGTEKDASSADFAAALARWQKSFRLSATGILDSETWSQMIRWFQSNRIKDRQYPTADQLVTAPASDFWDQSRAEQLRQVERETYAAYRRMVAAAIADASLGLSATSAGDLAPTESYLKILSAFRPREYQEWLRKQSPNSGREGLAVNSPHFTGRALDLYVGGDDPVSTKDSNREIQVRTRVYKWLVRNAAKFGFRPYFYEPWHWEYVGASQS